MPQIRALLQFVFGRNAKGASPCDPLDYEQVVHLDAEDLAEQGISSAYSDLRQKLLNYTTEPLVVAEEFDSDSGFYAVAAGGRRYEIWGPSVNSESGWARATVAFFSIVNANLHQSPHKFYALYGGNDLSGVFLTDEQYSLARESIKNPSYWPYLPVMEPPHYGFPAESAA
jgi:hypothetical protein